MSKGLEALENIIKTFYDKESEDIQIVRKELEDFEWLKSKVSIDWFDKLSSDDKIRFLEIMGWKYE